MGDIKTPQTTMLGFQISTFLLPPSGDILVLGKRTPIGPQAALKMLENVAPDQFDLTIVDDEVIEAILVKRFLFARVEKAKIIKAVLEHIRPLMSEQCMITVKCDVTLNLNIEV